MTAKTENIFKEAVSVFFANIVLFKKIAVIIGVITLLVAFLVPPTFDIGGSILVESKQLSLSPNSLSSPTNFNQVLPATPQDVETEVSLILSPQFFKFAARRMREQNILPASQQTLFHQLKESIEAGIEALKKCITELTGFEFDPPEDLLWKDLMDSVSAELVPGTNLVQLFYYTRFPEEDLKPAKLFMQSFLLFRMNSGSDPENSFYGTKLEEYERNYADLEKRKAELLREMDLAGDVNDEIQRLAGRVKDTEEELLVLREKRQVSQVWLDYLQNTMTQLEKQKKDIKVMPPFPLNFESSDIKEINTRLFELIIEYIRMSSIYTENFEQSRDARQNLRSLERYIRKMSENEVSLRHTQLGILDYQITEKESLIKNSLNQLQHLKSVAPELAILNAQLASQQNVIQTFIRRSEETRLQSEAGDMLQMRHVRIAAEPSVPEHPYFPRKRIVIPIGILGGILMGLLAVFTKHMFSRGFTSSQDVSRILNLPTLASISDYSYATPGISVLWRLDDAFPKTTSWLYRTRLYRRLEAWAERKFPKT